uniref:Transcription factor IIIB 90 kDa subunit n=1 Tax=Noccaea caerulescens TaxID=107243 RepID=A0A1J3EPK4_NOCCA
MEDFIDPSVYIPSLSKRVFEGRHDAVMKTARDIIATMKRDWIETGLELVGICAAALYTAALSNGFNCSTTETEKQEKPPATALEAVCKLILQRLRIKLACLGRVG